MGSIPVEATTFDNQELNRLFGSKTRFRPQLGGQVG